MSSELKPNRLLIGLFGPKRVKCTDRCWNRLRLAEPKSQEKIKCSESASKRLPFMVTGTYQGKQDDKFVVKTYSGELVYLSGDEIWHPVKFGAPYCCAMGITVAQEAKKKSWEPELEAPETTEVQEDEPVVSDPVVDTPVSSSDIPKVKKPRKPKTTTPVMSSQEAAVVEIISRKK